MRQASRLLAENSVSGKQHTSSNRAEGATWCSPLQMANTSDSTWRNASNVTVDNIIKWFVRLPLAFSKKEGGFSPKPWGRTIRLSTMRDKSSHSHFHQFAYNNSDYCDRVIREWKSPRLLQLTLHYSSRRGQPHHHWVKNYKLKQSSK
jgi:hypothetical protein